jgi:aldehyde dehydrogenase
MRYERPNTPGAKVQYKSRYENFIGGEFVKPARGHYFENITPVTGRTFCEIPRSTHEDIDRALDAAHAAKGRWGKTPPAERAKILNKIADVMEANLELLAVSESWDNGKPVRETLAADLPLAIDHFRYFAGCLRAEEGSLAELDPMTVAYHVKEPLGVVAQIIPWNFPLLMAAWKLAPALAAGNCVVLKPAEQTPVTILLWAELVGHLLPPGVLNIVNGFGVEAGKPLASSPRVAKVAFTGETTTGRLIMQYASENLIPVTLELGGKSPNIFFADVLAADDDYRQKALEGFAMFALNQGEVCTCPSRALIETSIYAEFLDMAVTRTRETFPGDPLDTATRVGAQASNDQLEKILSYIDIGKKGGREGAARRRARAPRRRPRGRVLRHAHGLRGPQQDAGLSRGDLRPGGLGDLLRGLRRRPSRSPTTRSTASAPACGPAACTPPTTPPAPFKPGACGPTATTSTPPTRPSAGTSTRASAARTTR